MQYFKNNRNVLGCGALTIAVLFSGLWGRSLAKFDAIVFQVHGYDNMIFSFDGALCWSRFDAAEYYAAYLRQLRVVSWSRPVARGALYVSPLRPIVTTHVGCALPYWVVVYPMTFVAMCLLLCESVYRWLGKLGSSGRTGKGTGKGDAAHLLTEREREE